MYAMMQQTVSFAMMASSTEPSYVYDQEHKCELDQYSRGLNECEEYHPSTSIKSL